MAISGSRCATFQNGSQLGSRWTAGLKRVLVHSGSDSGSARPCFPWQRPPPRFLFSVLVVKETGSDRKISHAQQPWAFERFGSPPAMALKPALKLTLNVQDNGGRRIRVASRPGNLPSPRLEHQRETDSIPHRRLPCRPPSFRRAQAFRDGVRVCQWVRGLP